MNDLKRYNYLAFEMDAVYHEASVKLGLSDSATRILYTLYSIGGIRCLLSEICRLSGVSKQTINSSLRRMEEDGILYLENYSGRRKIVCLTEKGQVLVESTVGRLLKKENAIFEAWSQEERQTYLALTEKYLTALKEKVNEL